MPHLADANMSNAEADYIDQESADVQRVVIFVVMLLLGIGSLHARGGASYRANRYVERGTHQR